MVKYKIYGEEKEDEDIVRLKLIRMENEVNVVVVDADGSTQSGGYLIDFKEDGTIRRNNGVSSKYGFKLDRNERIEMV